MLVFRQEQPDVAMGDGVADAAGSEYSLDVIGKAFPCIETVVIWDVHDVQDTRVVWGSYDTFEAEKGRIAQMADWFASSCE